MKFASMERKFIPNSKPANGRTLTRSRNRLRKKLPDLFYSWQPNQFGNQETRKIQFTIDLSRFTFFSWLPGFQIPFFRRVKGAWWSPQSSKLLPARSASWDRFDSYPLRLTNANRIANCGMRIADWLVAPRPSVIPSEVEESLIIHCCHTVTSKRKRCLHPFDCAHGKTFGRHDKV